MHSMHSMFLTSRPVRPVGTAALAMAIRCLSSTNSALFQAKPTLDFSKPRPSSTSPSGSSPRGPAPPRFGSRPARGPTSSSSSSSSSSSIPPRSKPRPADLLTKRHSPSQFVLLDPSTPSSTPSPDAPAPAPRIARTFSDLGLDDQVTEAMINSIRSSFGSAPPTHLAPTEIQSLAARTILDPPNPAHGGQPRAFMLAAETGSGKTLAYLAPVLHSIRAQEHEYAAQYEAYTKALAEAQQRHEEVTSHNAKVTEEEQIKHQTPIEPVSPSESAQPDLLPLPKLPPKPLPLRRPGYPRAVILVPSHELLMQVGSVAKAMSHTARARVVMATTSTPAHHLKRIMTEPVDVLITTPGSLAEFFNKEVVKLSETRVVVVDEADFIFDQGFAEETKEVVEHVCKVAHSRAKHHGGVSSSTLTPDDAATDFVPTFLFVTATVPKSLHAMLTAQFPGSGSLHFLATSSLHRPLMRCTQTFVDVARQFQSNKQAALLDVLRRTHDFDHGAALVFANTRQGVDTVYSFLTSRDIPQVLKLSKRQTIEERAATWHQFRTTPGAILVATDVAARGLDTTHVDLVVNFDFPSSALEYLHRIGRTARAGRKGKAVSLVTKRSKELVLAIQQRLKMKSGMGMGRMQ